MKHNIFKYLSVSFLMLLFIFRGLETVLPLVKGYLCEQSPPEISLTTESESSSEKSHEKWQEIKEFLGHFYDGYASPDHYNLLTVCQLRGRTEFIKKVFLPVTIPPPRL